jgi:hypothetical protein
MHRFSPLLFAIVISTPLLAQSRFDRSQTMDLITVTTYVGMSRTIPTLKFRAFSHRLLLPMDTRQAGWSSTAEQLGAEQDARNP